MKNKFFAIILLVTFFCFPINIQADQESLELSPSVSLIRMLGVTQRTSAEKDVLITRGEFIDMVIRAMGFEDNSALEAPFADVDSNTEYSASIAKAAEMGIIHGDGSGVFCPRDDLSFGAALKITVGALGYTNIAGVRGGYPIGYVSVGREIDLLAGIAYSDTQSMSFSDCAVLLYNFLNADLCLETGLVNGNTVQERAKGKCVLSEYHSLTKCEGVVSIAGYASLVPGYSSSESTMVIGGKSFKCEIENAEDYLGLLCDCWYDKNNSVGAVYVKPTNRSVTISADNIDAYSDFTLETHTENKNIKYKLDRTFTFAENGRNAVPQDSDFEIKNGYITLIDNDSDGKYDAALVFAAEYMVVSDYSKTDETVYDSNGKTPSSLKMSRENGEYYDFKIKNSDGYKDAALQEASSGMVLMYYVSKDGQYTKALGCTDMVEGTVTELGEDSIYIDSEEYKVNSYFMENTGVGIGYNGSFLLAADGTVTFATDQQKSDLSYGYLTGFREDKGVDKNIQVAVFTTAGKFIYPMLCDYITLDGRKTSKNDTAVFSALQNGNAPKYQLIRYELDAEGKLRTIDTALDVEPTMEPSEKYNKAFIGDNTLTNYLKYKKSFYYPSNHQFVPYAILGGSTVIIGVPAEIATGTETKTFEEKYFTILNSENLSGSKSYYIDAYDMDKYMRPSVVVVYDENGATSMEVAKDEDAAIVEKVTNMQNSNGDIVKAVTLWQQGRYYKYTIEKDACETLTAQGNIPMSGDIIRFKRNTFNEITSLVIDARYNAATKKPEMTAAAATDGHQADWIEYAGTVLSHTSDIVCLKVDRASGYSDSWSDPMEDNICPLWMYSYAVSAVYETETGIVRQGKTSLLRDAYAVGNDNASYVFVKCYSNGILQMFMYH